MTRNKAPCLLDEPCRTERLIPPAFVLAFRADLLSDEFEKLYLLRKAPNIEFRIDERSVDRYLKTPTRRGFQLRLGDVGVEFLQQ